MGVIPKWECRRSGSSKKLLLDHSLSAQLAYYLPVHFYNLPSPIGSAAELSWILNSSSR